MRIALAWELGANYGHLMRGRLLARSLRRHGHEVHFLVRDVRAAQQLLPPAGLLFSQCPVAPPVLQRFGRPPVNYSDLLVRQGYADAAIARTLVCAWLALLRTVDPQVVVIDHAPLALLSSRILSLSTLLLGAPFSIPPAVHPLPAMHPYRPAAPEDLLRADKRMLTTFNEVLAEYDCGALDSMRCLFAGQTYLTSFVELDCYGPRAEATYVGPIASSDSLPALCWTKDPGRKRVLAYLRPGLAGLEPLMQALRHAPVQLICVVPGAPDSMLDRWRREGIAVHNTPIDLSVLLPDADVVVNYGGLNGIAQALLQGVPFLLVPHELEQRMNAVRGAATGAGLIVDEERTEARFSAELHRLLEDPAYRSAARAFAEVHADYDQDAAVDRLAESVSGQVARPRGAARFA